MSAIIITEKPDRSSLLNANVVALRAILLDFEGTDLDVLGSSSKKPWNAESLIPYRCISKSAESIKEIGWPKFFLENFFHPLWDEMTIKDGDSRRVSRNKLYYEYFNHAQRRPWTLFGPSFRHCKPDWEGHAEPNPDWVASFPVYHQFQPYIGDSSAREQQRTSVQGESIVENFSTSTLGHLAFHGLEPSAVSIAQKEKEYVTFRTEDGCFPWLIVEHKKLFQIAKDCYWQAANAGASAVLMLKRLSMYAEAKEGDTHIPPVVTMTTGGKVVRIWIIYSHKHSTEFRMACIWRGDMTVVWDVIKLQAILGNLHTWAMRELRPWISSYIDQWKARFAEIGQKLLGFTGKSFSPRKAASVDENRFLSPPSSPASGNKPEEDQDYSDGSVFRQILQTEHQKLMDQFQQILQESLRKASQGDMRIPKPIPKNIFKKRIMVPWHANKISIKLPDVPSADLAKLKPGLVSLPTPPESYTLQSSKNQRRSPDTKESAIQGIFSEPCSTNLATCTPQVLLSSEDV